MRALLDVLRTSTLLWTLVLPSAIASESRPAVRFEPYTFETFGGKTADAELGAFSVPENRSRPDSRNIELRFVRFASTAAQPGPPIVYLAGGPGGSGITTARATRFELFMALREIGDVIAFDQRGTGESGGRELRCSETFEIPFDKPLDRARAGEILAEGTRDCAERLQAEGIDVRGYTTPQSAADLEDLRRALGVPKLTLWSISYGTHLALATAARYPDSIDRMILAGVESLDQTLKLPSDQEALLAEVAKRASQQPEIRARVPDLLASIRRLLQQLEESPVQVELIDPRSGRPFTVTLGALDLQIAVAGTLRGPESFRFLPDIIARMEGGDFAPLAFQASQDRVSDLGSMMSITMDCASGAGARRLRQIAHEARGTLLGDAINYPLPEMCAGSPVADLGDEFRTLPTLEIPSLLISGTLDGRTPPGNAEKILPALRRAHHLVLDGAGHSDPLFLSSPRILDTMLAFLRAAPELPERIEVPIPEWVEPREVAPLPAALAGRMAGAYRFGDGTEARLVPAGPALFLLGLDRRPKIVRASPDGSFFVELGTERLEIREKNGHMDGLTWIEADGSRRAARRVEAEERE